MKKILSITYSEKTKGILKEISSELNADVDQKEELTNFIYSLKGKKYHSVIIENNSDAIDVLKIVRLTKDICPNIPQIIISDDEDRQIISLLHQEGIFYKCVPPIEKGTLKKIIQSSFAFFDKQNKIDS